MSRTAIVLGVVAVSGLAATFAFAQEASTARFYAANVATVIAPTSSLTVEEVRVGGSCVVVVSGRGTNVAVAPCVRYVP